jgi:hypothetical protein
MLTPPLPHACFFHFSDTCSLGSNGSTKFLESMFSLILFWRAGPALVLECYVRSMAKGGFRSTFDYIESFFYMVQYRFYNRIRCRCFIKKDQAYTSKYGLLFSKSTVQFLIPFSKTYVFESSLKFYC